MDVLKPSLIDLEARPRVTGRKAVLSHRERLSERDTQTKSVCDSLTSGIMVYLKPERVIRSGHSPQLDKVVELWSNTCQWYSGYQSLNIAPSQVFSAAEYPIRQAAVAVSISGLEELQNSGEEAIIDLLESRIMNAEDTFDMRAAA